MVSQGSFCDSDGIPGYLQDGIDDDAVLQPRREVEDFPILLANSPVPVVVSEDFVSNPAGFSPIRVKTGFTGDIPVEDQIPSIDSASSSPFSPAHAIVYVKAREEAAVAALKVSHLADQDELVHLRTRLLALTSLLKNQGLSIDDINAAVNPNARLVDELGFFINQRSPKW